MAFVNNDQGGDDGTAVDSRPQTPAATVGWELPRQSSAPREELAIGRLMAYINNLTKENQILRRKLLLLRRNSDLKQATLIATVISWFGDMNLLDETIDTQGIMNRDEFSLFKSPRRSSRKWEKCHQTFTRAYRNTETPEAEFPSTLSEGEIITISHSTSSKKETKGSTASRENDTSQTLDVPQPAIGSYTTKELKIPITLQKSGPFVNGGVLSQQEARPDHISPQNPPFLRKSDMSSSTDQGQSQDKSGRKCQRSPLIPLQEDGLLPNEDAEGQQDASQGPLSSRNAPSPSEGLNRSSVPQRQYQDMSGKKDPIMPITFQEDRPFLYGDGVRQQEPSQGHISSRNQPSLNEHVSHSSITQRQYQEMSGKKDSRKQIALQEDGPVLDENVVGLQDAIPGHIRCNGQMPQWLKQDEISSLNPPRQLTRKEVKLSFNTHQDTRSTDGSIKFQRVALSSTLSEGEIIATPHSTSPKEETKLSTASQENEMSQTLDASQQAIGDYTKTDPKMPIALQEDGPFLNGDVMSQQESSPGFISFPSPGFISFPNPSLLSNGAISSSVLQRQNRDKSGKKDPVMPIALKKDGSFLDEDVLGQQETSQGHIGGKEKNPQWLNKDETAFFGPPRHSSFYQDTRMDGSMAPPGVEFPSTLSEIIATPHSTPSKEEIQGSTASQENEMSQALDALQQEISEDSYFLPTPPSFSFHRHPREPRTPKGLGSFLTGDVFLWQ